MKILVTGGSGYLGGSITELLNFIPNLSFKVYDNLTYEYQYLKKCNFINGDILDKSKLKKYLKEVDCVIWLAALVGDGACQINTKKCYEINTDSVKFLAENFNGRIIFTSTCSVYGVSKKDELLTEESEINPISDYAKSKLKAESYLKDKNAIIFRLGTLFGVSDSYSRIRFDLVVNKMTLDACMKNEIIVNGGTQWRPLINVHDVAATIIQAMNNEYRGIYNLNLCNKQINEIAEIFNKYETRIIKKANVDIHDLRNYRVSSEKAKKELNFKPEISIESSVDELYQVLEEGRIVNPYDKRHYNGEWLKLIA